MEKYKNEDYLKKTIMEQSRHMFIYGYNTDYRSKFLQSLEGEYPIIADSNKPVALYFDSLGIPKTDVSLKEKDLYLKNRICEEYLSFWVATKILEKTLEKTTVLDSKLSRLLHLMNRMQNKSFEEIKSIEDLLKEIKTSRDFYYEYYFKYIRGEVKSIPTHKISIPFMEIDMFVSNFKTGINLDSYIGIIIDKKVTQEISWVKAINNLISRRINKDISIKVALEPDSWEIYTSTNGQLIEATHDYGTIELDDSLKDNIKRKKKSIY